MPNEGKTPGGNPIMVFFHYFTNEVVRLGDVVVSENGNPGKVVQIFQPGTQDAVDFQCEEEGGVMIEEDWDGTPGLMLMTPPDGQSWEDLEFVRRGEAK